MAATTSTAASMAAATSSALPAATSNSSSSSYYNSTTTSTDLSTGIIVLIFILCGAIVFTIIGFVCFCYRRRKTKKKQASLLAIARQNVENARKSQQAYNQYPPPENGAVQGQPAGYTKSMPASPAQASCEKNVTQVKSGLNSPPLVLSEMESPPPVPSEMESPPPVPSEMYSPPASAELSTGAPSSSELDGSYGILPAAPNSEVSSPMLRKEHEQMYSNFWNAATRGV